MHISYEWMETAEILGTAGGCLIAALSLLVFLASCISTYHLSTTSATPQMVLITLIYPGLFVWGLFLATSIGATFVSAVLEGVCNTNEISSIWTHWNSSDANTVCATILDREKCVDCIDLYPYHFIFPPKARKEDMWICGREIFLFCHENMPRIASRYITHIFVDKIHCYVMIHGFRQKRNFCNFSQFFLFFPNFFWFDPNVLKSVKS